MLGTGSPVLRGPTILSAPTPLSTLGLHFNKMVIVMAIWLQ